MWGRYYTEHVVFIESVDSICRVSKDTQYTTTQLHYCTREFKKSVAMAVANNLK